MSNMTKVIAVLGVVAGLGVAALPLSSYAAPTKIEGSGNPLKANKDVEVQLTVEETLSMYVTDEAGDTDITTPVILSTTDKENYTASPVAVKVEAGNKEGYHLTLHGSGTGTTATSLFNNNATTPAEIATVSASNAWTSTTSSAWGYKVLKGANGSTIDGEWKEVVAATTPATIDSLGTAGVQTTKVTFGAHVVPGQESGIYEGKVTFTATAGPEA